MASFTLRERGAKPAQGRCKAVSDLLAASFFYAFESLFSAVSILSVVGKRLRAERLCCTSTKVISFMVKIIFCVMNHL